MNQFVLNKKEIITSIFILLCLAGYVYFPASGYFQYKAVAVIFLVLLPFLYNKYFLKEKNIFKRILIGDWKNNLIWSGLGLIGSLFVMFLIFKFTNIGDHYFLASAIKNDFWVFLEYELFGVAFTVMMYEIFFRGFVLFHFSVYLKKWAILVQFLFFLVMLLMLFDLPYWFYINYLVFAPFAGWIAYKGDSILYSFVGQLIFVIIVDALYIALNVN